MTSSQEQQLNQGQLKAVETTEGPCVIAAGPGTGKTHTLAHRIAYLLQEKQALAAQILAVTFTRTAAAEMKERIRRLLEGSSWQRSLENLWIETFHAAALRLLREQDYPFGAQAEFSLANDQQKFNFLEGLVPSRQKARFLEEVRLEKQKLLFSQTAIGIAYQKRLLANRLLDFDDLIIYACRLFEEKPEVLRHYRGRWRYLLMDEFQDTSFAQYQFMRYLATENICVIGDPDQSIYGFAEKPFKPFEEFKKDYPQCAILPLVENYRSQATILEAAKQVIQKNQAQIPRQLRARMEEGLPIEIMPNQTDRQEAEMVVRRIESLLGGASYYTIDSRWADKESESYVYGLGDIAILYRFHAQASKLEQVLLRAGLPFRTFGKKANPSAEAVSTIEDLEDFKKSERGAPSMMEPKAEAITLMTLHRSKGLEFPVVFLAGCEEGVLPCHPKDPGHHPDAIEQERRLFYVGMTRAKNRLFLCYAKSRFLFGRSYEGGPSPFLLDIEKELLELKESRVAAKKRRAAQTQPTLF